MSDPTPEKPQAENESKLHVDEDWKNQVHAEKEAFQQMDGDQSQGAGSRNQQQIPEASFSMLVTTLATQATLALGQMPTPDGQQPSVDLTLAKHFIDTLDVLEEKTKGNLTPQESGMLSGVLHQLRMLYVDTQSKAGTQSQTEQKPNSSIELP
ncbi:MAG: DUF1844 domain-containing protein [Planctomycetota bacterium]